LGTNDIESKLPLLPIPPTDFSLGSYIKHKANALLSEVNTIFSEKISRWLYTVQHTRHCPCVSQSRSRSSFTSVHTPTSRNQQPTLSISLAMVQVTTRKSTDRTNPSHQSSGLPHKIAARVSHVWAMSRSMLVPYSRRSEPVSCSRLPRCPSSVLLLRINRQLFQLIRRTDREERRERPE
jgi:hypothetical protein